MICKINVNGKEHSVEVHANETLLSVLRDLGYFGVKPGCVTCECGACVILIDVKTIN